MSGYDKRGERMTREEAIKMAKADLKCMERDTSGQDEMCNSHKCDECSLNYERGNIGEQKEWLRLAIKELEQEPTTKNDLGVETLISHLEPDNCGNYVVQSVPVKLNITEIKKHQSDFSDLEQESFINKTCVSEKVCEHDKEVVLGKIRAEIEKQEKWLLQAGYNTYNVDIAFNSIKLALAKSEVDNGNDR